MKKLGRCQPQESMRGPKPKGRWFPFAGKAIALQRCREDPGDGEGDGDGEGGDSIKASKRLYEAFVSDVFDYQRVFLLLDTF